MRKMKRVKQWLLLKSDHSNANMGYYFPEETTVNVKSETRKGTYKAINEAFPSDKEYVGDYRTFTIQHGQHNERALCLCSFTRNR